jgi:hypothetical protein
VGVGTCGRAAGVGMRSRLQVGGRGGRRTMTALQAGAPWELPRSRRWVWRVSPAHLGRAERKRGLSRVARCTALIAALTWAVTLAPVVEAQQAHTTAASAATPPAAFTVANSEADPLAVLGVGLRKVLDDLRAGRPISARGGLPQRAAAVEALPAFLSYPVLEAMALALPALALPALALSEHVLTPHPGALSNAFVSPLPMLLPRSRCRGSSSACPPRRRRWDRVRSTTSRRRRPHRPSRVPSRHRVGTTAGSPRPPILRWWWSPATTTSTRCPTPLSHPRTLPPRRPRRASRARRHRCHPSPNQSQTP